MTTNEDLSLIEQAEGLLYFGLKGKQNPSEKSHYKDLLRKYQINQDFRKIFESIAKGQKLNVIEVNEKGVFLRPEPNSIYHFKKHDISSIVNDEMEPFSLIILVGIAAWFFPDNISAEKQLRETDFITVEEIVALLEEYCVKMVKNALKDKDEEQLKDPEVGEEELVMVAQRYLSLHEDSKLGSSEQKTKQGYIRRVLNFLESQNYLLEDDDKYYLTPRFKYEMDYMVQNEEMKGLIQILKN